MLVTKLSGRSRETRRSRRRRNNCVVGLRTALPEKKSQLTSNLSCDRFEIFSALTLRTFQIHLLPDLSSPPRMRTLRPVSFLILTQRICVVSSTCYWPDGSISKYHAPCNSIANGFDSACCGNDDVCSSSGYCLGRNGYMYRGACTDRAGTPKRAPKNAETVSTQSPWHICSVDVILTVIEYPALSLMVLSPCNSAVNRVIQTTIVAATHQFLRLEH